VISEKGLGRSSMKHLKYIKLFSIFSLIKDDDGNEVVLSDKGAFWLHALEDIFSLDYVGRLWGTSKQNLGQRGRFVTT